MCTVNNLILYCVVCVCGQVLCIMGKLSCACLNVQIHCKTELVPVDKLSVGSYISQSLALLGFLQSIILSCR